MTGPQGGRRSPLLLRLRRRLFWLNPPWWSLLPLLARLKGIRLGRQSQILGWPVIRRYPESRILVGGQVVLNSSRRAYPLGIHAPVKLATYSPTARIVIGDRVGINGSAIVARSRTIEIGDDTIVAANCMILDSDWHHLYAKSRWRGPGSDRDLGDADVRIGRNVWLGVGCLVLKGVSIGDNSVIGAGSVVTRNIPADCIAAGVPARPLGPLPNSPGAGEDAAP